MAKKYESQVGSLFKKEAPKMPEGYYSGDKPNPNLRAFVELHRKVLLHNDDYSIPPFSRALHIANRRSPLNDLHIYWSKKPYAAVQTYIDHYTHPGDLLLDPFAGSGGTALCALIRGCSAVAIDLSPAATFITKYYCTPVSTSDFRDAFNEVNRKVAPTLKWLYESKTPMDKEANLAYMVWSQVFRCDRCLSFVPIGHCVEVPAYNKNGTPKLTSRGQQAMMSVCPICHAEGVNEPIKTGSKRFGKVPIRASVVSKEHSRMKRHVKEYPFPKNAWKLADHITLDCIAEACDSNSLRFDIDRLIEIRGKKIPFHFPTDRMMNVPDDCQQWGVLWRAGVADFQTVDEVFEKRALWALSAYFDAVRSAKFPADISDALLGVLSSALWNCSRMYRERKKGGGPQEGVFYLPPLSREVSVTTVVKGKYETFIRANEEFAQSLKSTDLLISTQSATDLSGIPANSIDYIFTDPPYSWKVPYGELNFLWESFLGLDRRWHTEEIIVSDVRGIGEREWGRRLKIALSECYRVLKPGRCLTLCYHDSSEGSWESVQDIMAESGFIAEKSDFALSIGTDQKSLKQLTSGKITQRDLIINFRKPSPSQVATIGITGCEDKRSFNEKVVQIIRDYIGANPGCTKDRIYDEVVSRMVRSGQMEAHNFSEFLSLVAEESKVEREKGDGSRWYLKETELLVDDAAETAHEDAAAEKIGAFIKGHIKKHPVDEGIHYGDLFEHYIYTVKDKPRRKLTEFVPDYFYKTEQGTWRLPASEDEERAKHEARVKGLGRRIKRYIAQLEQGVIISKRDQPNDATLAEWIRHCKRAGFYEQGKFLYEKGGLDTNNLPEEAIVNVEEDYQVCVRMIARGAVDESGKKRKRRRE